MENDSSLLARFVDPVQFPSRRRQGLGDLSQETASAAGRALIRSCSLLSSETCDEQAPKLQRSNTVQMGALSGPADGRVTRTRAASVGARKPRARHDAHEHEDHTRGASLPPVKEAAETSPREVQVQVQVEAPLSLMASRDVTNEVREVIKTSNRAFNRDVRRQLRFVVGGLMGSGKSTLCRMLAKLLGGVWVNQDEFSHQGKGAKRAFLCEITREAEDKKIPVLIVDKINTMRQHRREILEAMHCGVSGDIVFIQMVHPSDKPGRLNHQRDLCLARIRARGEGHRTLMGNDPKLESILRMTVGGAEPVSEEELALFAAHFTVDMTLPPTQSTMQLLSDLDSEGLLGRFHLDELVTMNRLEEALSFTQAAEHELTTKHETPAELPVKQPNKHVRKIARPWGVAPKRPAPYWIWTVDFDDASEAKLKRLWGAHAAQSPELRPNDDLHVTLLFVGGVRDQELASRYPKFPDAETFAGFRRHLESNGGHMVELEVATIVMDERIAAAKVSGIDQWCANVYPHITLAYRRGVPPKLSNEVLARQAANLDFEVGLKPWLAELGLMRHEAAVLEWCRRSGISSVDEVAKHAANLAAMLEHDVDQRARTKLTLLGGATGNLHCVQQAPLKLTGVVRGRRRGE